MKQRNATSGFVPLIVLSVLVATIFVDRSSPNHPNRLDQRAAVQAFGSLPLSFEANRGQTDDRVDFLARGRGYTLFLTRNEAVLALSAPSVRDRNAKRSDNDCRKRAIL